MNQGYLSDEELKRLIEDVEDNKMLQAPANLKRQVLETLDADKSCIRTKKQRKKLVIFEMKIAGGLAAAMLMLFLLPITAQGEQAGETGGERADRHGSKDAGILPCMQADFRPDGGRDQRGQ